MFRRHGMSPPRDQQMYQLYQKFDADRNTVLDARECLCLVDALFRSVFYAEHGGRSRSNSPGAALGMRQVYSASHLSAAVPSYVPAAGTPSYVPGLPASAAPVQVLPAVAPVCGQAYPAVAPYMVPVATPQ